MRRISEEYYRKHPEQFGAKTVKQYEAIASSSALADADRDKLLAALKDADKQKNTKNNYRTCAWLPRLWPTKTDRE